jgi:hypothetical protein
MHGFYFPGTSREGQWFLFYGASTQYRQFAEECRRFARLAKTDEQRKILLEMEAVWTKLAEEAEDEWPRNKIS